ANAVVHRDYSIMGSQIDLYMFDDRIEILSPGGLSGGLTKDDLANVTGKRHLRNPSLAGLLYELRLVEKAGTGVAKMFRDMSENGSAPPVFEIDSNSVKVILKSHPDYAAHRKFEEALVAKDRGDVNKARSFLEDAIKIKPNYSEAIALLASLEGEAGSLEKARGLYQTAFSKNPRNASSIISWALLEDRLGNDREARSLYDRASIIDPSNVHVWYAWGVLERKMGDFVRARNLFQKTVDLAPDNSANWQALGQTEIRAGNFGEAERLLSKALELAQDDYAKAWIHSDLAYAKARQKRPRTEVETNYKTSLALNPNSAETNFRYSQWLRRVNRNYEAEEFERKARLLGWQERERRPYRR
ncbi:MAG TPA: ATP-binding protein, partial [Nitrososphaerales archaeon]|nr:ATP-binding protein [Nitrososphaerales archaeon]